MRSAKLLFCFCLIGAGASAQQAPLERLVDTARLNPAAPELAQAITSDLGPHGGVAVWGQNYVFASDFAKALTAKQHAVSIDGEAPLDMQPIPGSNLYIRVVLMRVGVTHSYQYFADGQPAADRSDVPGYNPDSYPHPGLPKGTLSPKQTITSKIYDGMKVDFWWYASPGVDPNTPAPVMVWQDGQNVAKGDLGPLRLFTVTENLVAQKLIPPMVHVMVAPGTSADGKPMRSIEYDTVSDRYARFLLDEVLPLVEKQYKLRHDGYSRAIAGESSGGIASFAAAWFLPDQFSRVQSAIGSYTSIQWHPEEKQEGGYIFPFMVRKQPKRDIRVWMSDGTDDLENDFGSWPMQNIELANSLKRREYDFHFRFGLATHNSSQAAIDLPESLSWLWRGYDPAKTSVEYAMEPSEKSKPYYRVRIDNRDSW